MTAITYVSQAEMQKRTGLKGAAGYAFPEEDTILIRKGLTKAQKKEVLAHEEEHIAKGEEGPFLGTLIGVGASLLGGLMSSRSQKKAAKTAAAGSAAELQYARESRDLARSDQAPYREAGATALQALMSMTGLGGGGGGGGAAPAQPLTSPQQIRQDRADFTPMSPVDRSSSYRARYGGGAIGYAGGGQMYNINELGPENIYADGAITRGRHPSTIDGVTGYVQPNIESRYGGGPMQGNVKIPDPAGYGGPQGPIQGGPATSQPPQNIGGVTENPGGVEGGYNFMTDPGYGFRIGEGQRALERSAAARGGLLSGGTGKALTRYAQDYASNEYTNVYNRISNIAGLGQVSAGQSGGYAMQGGQLMGNAASQGANATAYGQVGAGNAWANAGNQIAQLPWGQVFNRNTAPAPGLSGSNGGPI